MDTLLTRIIDPMWFCQGSIDGECMAIYVIMPFFILYYMAVIGLIVWIPAQIISLIFQRKFID